MKIKIHTIYDSKTNAYTTPKYALTTAAAIRTFSDEANDSSTYVSKHPTDFTLFEIGEFDATSGAIEVYQAPKALGTAANFVSANN